MNYTLRGLILCNLIVSVSEAIQKLVFSFQFSMLDCFRLCLRNDVVRHCEPFTEHLQNLVFYEKARSASIFVAVCVSAR
ncbi:MAG: hypothetical protein LBH32_05215 [Dysgonamonadaceae bacterium]|jgi:hypothetical protein|nr:hypothetical protein [Dysgonamonadaceae bacterium]